MKVNVLAVVLFLGFFLCLSVFSIAGGPPGPPMGPPPCWPPPCIIPIDGGISFLVIAGAALGGKKIYDLRKK